MNLLVDKEQEKEFLKQSWFDLTSEESKLAFDVMNMCLFVLLNRTKPAEFMSGRTLTYKTDSNLIIESSYWNLWQAVANHSGPFIIKTVGPEFWFPKKEVVFKAQEMETFSWGLYSFRNTKRDVFDYIDVFKEGSWLDDLKKEVESIMDKKAEEMKYAFSPVK